MLANGLHFNSAGTPQRETVLCVNAATLMTALHRLERSTATTLDTKPNQKQVAQTFTNKYKPHYFVGYVW